jgi:polyphosphate kinase
VAGEFYIGSADWMRRNLSGRIEVVTPVLAGPLKGRLWETLGILLRDRRQAWIMKEDGRYELLQPAGKTPDGKPSGLSRSLWTLHAAAQRKADPTEEYAALRIGDSHERSSPAANRRRG